VNTSHFEKWLLLPLKCGKYRSIHSTNPCTVHWY